MIPAGIYWMAVVIFGRVLIMGWILWDLMIYDNTIADLAVCLAVVKKVPILMCSATIHKLYILIL